MAAKLYTPGAPAGIAPSQRLAGHTALVTGGARRVGAGISADLLDAEALPGLIGEARACFAALHLLVNNASTFYPTPLGSITLAQWDDLLGSNLRAPLLLAQAAAPELRR